VYNKLTSTRRAEEALLSSSTGKTASVIPITHGIRDRLDQLLGVHVRAADALLTDVALVTTVVERFLRLYEGINQ
jgi:hypothetical protein